MLWEKGYWLLNTVNSIKLYTVMATMWRYNMDILYELEGNKNKWNQY